MSDGKELTKAEIEKNKPCPYCDGQLRIIEHLDRVQCYCEDCEDCEEGEGSTPHLAYMSLFNKAWM